MKPSKIMKICSQITNSFYHGLINNSLLNWQNDIDIECLKEKIKFFLKNEYASAIDFHTKWYDKRKKKGWVFNLKYSETNKKSPKIIPYHCLPPQEKTLENIIINTIKILKNFK